VELVDDTYTTVDESWQFITSRELNVYMNGQRLKHDTYPVYLDVNLDLTLSCSHLFRHTPAVNNLNVKLAGTSWCASAGTLRTSALALCYSDAVWARSSYTNLIDTQLHSSMRLQPMQLSWLPVLSNTAPPSLRVKRQLTICFKPSKPIQIGLCMLMSLRIHLHRLHLGAQYGKTYLSVDTITQ